MAQSNNLNPEFGGRAAAQGFDALHGNGISVTAKDTSGTTVIQVFRNPIQFAGAITGVFLIAKDTTTGNIVVKRGDDTVATIAKGASAGALVGASSLANADLTPDDSVTIESSTAGNATVFISYKVTS